MVHGHSNRIDPVLGHDGLRHANSYPIETRRGTVIILGFVAFVIIGALARWIYRGLVRFTRRVWDEEGRK
jgi:hypothetical protein